MLPAAWRKTWVSRATGTGPASISSANGLPAPTGASWSASPTSTTCIRLPTARSRVTSSSRFAIEVSSTISRSPPSSSTVGPSPGTQPSAEWIVEASRPVDSAIRRAARPVGATSTSDAAWAAAAELIRRTVAVLPVPGPPVTIESRDANAPSTARHCSCAGTTSSAAACVGAFRRGLDAASSRTRSANSASSAAVSGRYAQTAPSASTSSTSRPASAIAAKRDAAGGGPPSVTPAVLASSPTGRHVEPPFSASASTWSTPASVRAGESRETPPERAIRSAIWNPTPNTLVSSYGRRRTTSCAEPP